MVTTQTTGSVLAIGDSRPTSARLASNIPASSIAASASAPSISPLLYRISMPTTSRLAIGSATTWICEPYCSAEMITGAGTGTSNQSKVTVTVADSDENPRASRDRRAPYRCRPCRR